MVKSKSELAKEQRQRYAKNAAYREKKKQYRKDYEKSHEEHEEKMSRKYYSEHPSYRRKKIQDARMQTKKKSVKKK